MSPEDEPKTNNEPADAAHTAEASAPGRRPSRGRRSRGRHRKRRGPPAEQKPEEREAQREQPADTSVQEESLGPDIRPVYEEPLARQEPEEHRRSETLPTVPPPGPEEPIEPGTLQGAIEQVNQVIETLRGALDDMEEVLESLEAIERQTGADQRELDSLRRALRSLHRGREGGQGHHR